ncbi:MAG: hypothetical protein ABI837_06080 [Acidobacteriota bacterium]
MRGGIENEKLKIENEGEAPSFLFNSGLSVFHSHARRDLRGGIENEKLKIENEGSRPPQIFNFQFSIFNSPATEAAVR